MAIPKPEPRDWLIANAQELRATDREVLQMLREAKLRADAILKGMPKDGKLIERAQLERTRALLLAEQAKVFERLGDITAARRASASSRAARLSAASNAALLSLVGKSTQAQFLYDSALQTSQRAIDATLQRMNYSALPLSERVYRTGVWMGGRLSNLINQTMATGLNAQTFAKNARDWFNPNTPGGIRFAAMRLARTEINNAFHSMSAQKYAETPWIENVDWNLSKSHPKPDECDAYAKASPYPSKKVPARPHPQCMCYITAEPIAEEDFIDNFLKGDYDEYLDGELEKNGWFEPEAEPQREKAAKEANAVKVPVKETMKHPPVAPKQEGMPQGDGKPEFVSLEAAGLLDVGSEFLYHGDSRKEYLIIPKHVRVEGPRVGNGPKARTLIDVKTGKMVGQQASSAAKWWIEKITDSKRRRDDPEYKKHYERGWKAGAGRNDLSRADDRGEPDAYYDGFSDRSIGMPKWTRADERDELEKEGKTPPAEKVDPVTATPAPSSDSSLSEAKGRIKNTVKGELRDAVEAAMDRLHSVAGDRIERVKSVTKQSKNVSAHKSTQGAFAFCDNGHVHLHSEIEDKKNTIKQSMSRTSPLGGYFVYGDGDPLRNITAHEMGHAMMDLKFFSKAQQNELRQAIVEALRLPDADLSLDPEGTISAGNKAIIKTLISKYAARNGGELVAEIWAEYTMSPNPSAEVKRIGDVMNRLVQEGRRKAS